jgi:NAD-dependent deacetylase
MNKKRLVVLSGAGISAESGLKTFRDSDGLWEGYDINEVATYTAWRRNPALVLEFYNMRRKSVREAQPNEAHYIVAELQNWFDVQVITQNIDDLHERAGSNHVLHLHGSIFKMRSETDGEKNYPIFGDIKLGDLAPDGSQFRPDIVWFEEPVYMMEPAARLTKTADVFLIIGTSLVVYPAASLVDYAPATCPKFVIDKKVPDACQLYNLTKIEKRAGEGMKEVKDLLLKMAD